MDEFYPPVFISDFSQFFRSSFFFSVGVAQEGGVGRREELAGVLGRREEGEEDCSAGRASRQIEGFRLTIKQFHALLVKRFNHAIRSHKDFFSQVNTHTHTQYTWIHLLTLLHLHIHTHKQYRLIHTHTLAHTRTHIYNHTLVHTHTLAHTYTRYRIMHT